MKNLKKLKEIKEIRSISKESQKSINGGAGYYCCEGTPMNCSRWCMYGPKL